MYQTIQLINLLILIFNCKIELRMQLDVLEAEEKKCIHVDLCYQKDQRDQLFLILFLQQNLTQKIDNQLNINQRESERLSDKFDLLE